MIINIKKVWDKGDEAKKFCVCVIMVLRGKRESGVKVKFEKIMVKNYLKKLGKILNYRFKVVIVCKKIIFCMLELKC